MNWPDPDAPNTCRQMTTRRCPISYAATGCGTNPCARYESSDEDVWADDVRDWQRQAEEEAARQAAAEAAWDA